VEKSSKLPLVKITHRGPFPAAPPLSSTLRSQPFHLLQLLPVSLFFGFYRRVIKIYPFLAQNTRFYPCFSTFSRLLKGKDRERLIFFTFCVIIQVPKTDDLTVFQQNHNRYFAQKTTLFFYTCAFSPKMIFALHFFANCTIVAAEGGIGTESAAEKPSLSRPVFFLGPTQISSRRFRPRY